MGYFCLNTLDETIYRYFLLLELIQEHREEHDFSFHIGKFQTHRSCE